MPTLTLTLTLNLALALTLTLTLTLTLIRYNCPRAATVRCAVPGTLWGLDRVTFRCILMAANKQTLQTTSQEQTLTLTLTPTLTLTLTPTLTLTLALALTLTLTLTLTSQFLKSVSVLSPLTDQQRR